MTGQALLEGAAAHGGTLLTRQGTEHRATTDAEGRFTLEDLPAGEHTLVAQRLDSHEATQAVQVQAGETVSVTLQLAPEPGALQGLVIQEAVPETPSGLALRVPARQSKHVFQAIQVAPETARRNTPACSHPNGETRR